MNFVYSRSHLVSGVLALSLAGASTLTPPAQAAQLQQGFAGAYAPANWTLNLEGPYLGDASVDTTGAPDSITLIGSRTSPTEDFFYTEYIIRAAASGPVSFDWNFKGFLWAYANTFGYRLNNQFIEISGTYDTTGPIESEVDYGTAQFNVSLGDVFGFYNFADDDCCSPGIANISNFSAPVPGPLPVLGIGTAFSYSRRLRRRTTRANGPVSTDPVNPGQL
jgi:hypothetical protein